MNCRLPVLLPTSFLYALRGADRAMEQGGGNRFRKSHVNKKGKRFAPR
jgi:hypothetical protein